MTERLSDLVGRNIAVAVEALSVPQMVKDQLEHEVVPFMAPSRSDPRSLNLNYIIGLGLPTRNGDYVMLFRPLEDPHSEAETGTLVRRLVADVQQQVTEADQRMAATLNGGKIFPGGLYTG